MGDVRKGDGRTVLFVSHNMSAIQKLCNSAILMQFGRIEKVGETSQIINSYLQNADQNKCVFDVALPENFEALAGYAYKIQIEDDNSNLADEIPVGKFWQVRVFFKIAKKVDHFIIALGINTLMDVGLRTSWSEPADLEQGLYEAVFKEELLLLSAGSYNLIIGLSASEKSLHYIENAASITISNFADKSLDKTIIRLSDSGLLLNPFAIKINKS